MSFSDTWIELQVLAKAEGIAAVSRLWSTMPGNAALLARKVAEADGGETPSVKFFPSGGSSGGELFFAFRGRSYSLRINWLTGRAHAEAL